MVENTFAPNVKNKELTIPQIVLGLQSSVIHYNKLPDEVKKQVDDWLDKNSESD